MKQVVIVANWKMNKTVEESAWFAKNFFHRIDDQLHSSNCALVVCPSLVAIGMMNMYCSGTQIQLGAQDVSAESKGSFTGQVDACSLAQLGVTYCIVGHPELRVLYQHNALLIVQKLQRLREHTIVPILCLTEPKVAAHVEQSLMFLTEQLVPLISTLNQQKSCIIAYEPIQSIGTAVAVSPNYVKALFAQLDLWLQRYVSIPYDLAYGGSVACGNAAAFLAVPQLSALLIGNASLTYEGLSGIISLVPQQSDSGS